jgi:magnesium-transporting ATPase (P-type)
MRKEAKMKKAEDRSPLPAMSIIILVILTSYTIAKLESILHRSVPYIIQFQQDGGLKNIWELAPRVVWVNIVGDIAFALFCITCFVVAHNYLKENFWVNAKKRRMVTIASYLLLFGGILLAVMAAN